MKLVVVKNDQEMSQTAARFIMEQVKRHPHSVLGLATGGTVVGTYAQLIDLCKLEKQSFQHVRTVNLDEYVGLSSENLNSYHYFMRDHLFDHIDIPVENYHLPNGLAKIPANECERYEQLIESLGGIDLQLLGIGRNGHIGFNEPGTSFLSRTHVVRLTESTRQANARYFPSLEEVPTEAITMGIATIMNSKKILLLVSGKHKANILQQLFYGPLDERIPASILKTHPHVTIIADEEAVSLLDRNDLEVNMT
ncbi:glucosamine-6-phosphate deaminase [Neobacillus sp. D3-1R]|uniref:glucosamine-6-phosphate deaminase n=1 Tax=Neobacillus sp. D3-1R TaxID=3445778 RepID=UPI003FA07999